MTMTVWAPFLASQSLLFHCDNQSVVRILTSGSSKCRHIMSLVRYLFFIRAKFNTVLRAVHIPGILNCASDTGPTLSRVGARRGPPAYASLSAELGRLQMRAAHYFHKGLADNTHRTYSSAQR